MLNIKHKYLNLKGMFIAEKPTINSSVQNQLLIRFGITYLGRYI